MTWNDYYNLTNKYTQKFKQCKLQTNPQHKHNKHSDADASAYSWHTLTHRLCTMQAHTIHTCSLHGQSTPTEPTDRSKSDVHKHSLKLHHHIRGTAVPTTVDWAIVWTNKPTFGAHSYKYIPIVQHCVNIDKTTLPLTQFTPGCHTVSFSRSSVLSGRDFRTGSERSCIRRYINCVIAATPVPCAQATSSGRGSSPAVNDKDVSIILHQQQTMHVAHNIPNTIHTFSEGTQKGSLCTYSALCSITCCMNPQLGNTTCICTVLGLTHTGTCSTKGSVCVYTPRGRKGWGQSWLQCYSYTLNVFDKKILQWLTENIQ